MTHGVLCSVKYMSAVNCFVLSRFEREKFLCLGEWKSLWRVLISRSSSSRVCPIHYTINWSGEKFLTSLSRALVELSEIYLFIYCFVGCSSTIFGYNTKCCIFCFPLVFVCLSFRHIL